MDVVVTGGTGLIGQHLIRKLEERGDSVTIVSRSETGDNYLQWEPTDPSSLELPQNTDAVIHLAGAPLFGQRWSDEFKQTIRESRVEGTRTVVNAIETSNADVQSFVCGSAVGYYGDRDDEQLTEDAAPGDGFLADVCVEWEDAARTIEDGPDPALIRTGIVLSMKGGALSRMLNPFPGIWPFHWGMGGPLGSGKNYMPWIHIEDEVNAIIHLMDEQLTGVYNLAAPNPVRNKKYTEALANVLNRPAFFPLPYFVMYLLYGEAAGVLYASQRAYPEALRESGFEFKYESIQPALEDLLADGG
jgi:uncharacterized protein (TIGR01777 family)